MSLRAVISAMILVVVIVAAITWKNQLVPVQGTSAPSAAPSGEASPATPPRLEAANDPGMTWTTPRVGARNPPIPSRHCRLAAR